MSHLLSRVASTSTGAIPTGARNITRVTFPKNLYKSQPKVRGWINYQMKQLCAQPGGWDSKGAETAQLDGGLHQSGSEPEHFTFLFLKADGTNVPVTHPKTKATVTRAHIIFPGINSTADLTAAADQTVYPAPPEPYDPKPTP